MGTNPFIDSDAPAPPKRAYRLTLRNSGQVFEVNPEALPEHEEGQVGSVLATLLQHDVEVDHACGGVLGCSTCHIYVWQGEDSAPEAIEEEEDMLDYAPAVKDNSRLACQFVPDGTQDVEVEIPSWKRNEVSEGP